MELYTSDLKATHLPTQLADSYLCRVKFIFSAPSRGLMESWAVDACILHTFPRATLLSSDAIRYNISWENVQNLCLGDLVLHSKAVGVWCNGVMSWMPKLRKCGDEDCCLNGNEDWIPISSWDVFFFFFFFCTQYIYPFAFSLNTAQHARLCRKLRRKGTVGSSRCFVTHFARLSLPCHPDFLCLLPPPAQGSSPADESSRNFLPKTYPL